MKSKREVLFMVVVLGIAVALCALVALPTLMGGPSNARKGDPNDVTKLVETQLIIGQGRPERGAASPKYTLVMFGDYECASCGAAQSIVAEVLKTHPDVRFIFRHATMSTDHQFARIASRAAEAARLQGKFWEVHDLLYANQEEWTRDTDPRMGLMAIAEAAGCERKQFRSDMETRDTELDAIVTADQDAAFSCSVTSTPSFFLITGQRTWAAIGPVGLKRLRDDPKYWE